MANNCTDYCLDDPMGLYETVQCGDFLQGGFPGFVLLECNHQVTDASNGVEILAEIAAGRAHLIEGCSIDFQAPTPVTRESNSPCNETPVLISYDRKGSYDNDNVTSTNTAFHDQLFDGRNFAGLIALNCADDDAERTVYWVDATITFRGGWVGGKKSGDGQKFSGEFTWRSKKNPAPFDAPTGVFTGI